MSFEKACLFEIGDIAAVHFRCKQCGSEVVHKVGRLTSANWPVAVTASCAGCHTPSGVQADTVEGEAFMHFIDSLGRMAQAANGRNLRIVLEIAPPTDLTRPVTPLPEYRLWRG
jgi:hypothetical protein